MAYSSHTAPVAVDHPPPGSAADAQEPSPNHTWILVCLFLLAVTWLPLFGIHLYRTSLSDAGTGTAVVVFPPTSTSAAVFQGVMKADGSLIRPVSWLRRTWIVHSLEPGFAGRLREQGAWGVFSPDLLSVQALFNCFRLADPSPNSAPTGTAAPAS